MSVFSDKDKAEYYHRCYKTVDGLWFVKSEEKFDFDTALELDREVWNVMPKIQARFIKKKLGAGEGLKALEMCLSQKLELDGFKFQVEKKEKDGILTGIEFKISTCPWHEILIKSGREHLSDKIGGVICGIEYETWALEFGEDIRFSFGDKRICRGDPCCILQFESDKISD
jgi:hypothetical protein